MRDALVRRYLDARADPRSVILEGFHALKHAIRFGADILHAATDRPDEIHRLAQELAPDVLDRLDAVITIDTERLEELVDRTPATRLVAIAARPAYDLDAALDRRRARIVFLERPRHLGNLGAAIRVAAAAGADAVLTSGEHDPWHPAAIRGSAGLHFALPVLHVDGLPHTDRPVVALRPGGEMLRSGLIPADAVLAFGSERHGLGDETAERADQTVAIPMRPGVSSLNLATAVAVALYAGPGAGGA